MSNSAIIRALGKEKDANKEPAKILEFGSPDELSANEDSHFKKLLNQLSTEKKEE